MTATVQPAAVVPSASSPGYISLRSNHEQRVTGSGAGGGSGRSYYNEHDPKAAAWLRELIAAGHIAPGDVDERSIIDVKPHELYGYTQQHFFAGIGGWSLALRLAGWPDSQPVRTGSCPCQPFSNAGQRLGEADARHLWPNFRDLITFGEPTITFGEQVASAAGRDWLAGIRADLEGLGYEVGAADLCAAGVGAPHPRQRLYWMANPDVSRKYKRPSGRQQSVRDEGGNDPARVGDAASAGLEGQWDEYRPHGCGEGSGLAGLAMQVGVPEWNGPTLALLCQDGARRASAQSGAFPVGYGIPARMGRLRGYGNAIVPQVAAEFVSACIEAVRLGGGGGVLVGRCAPTTEAKCNE